MTHVAVELPPPVAELPVKFNHWGEPLQSDFRLIIGQQVLLAGLQRYAWHRVRPGAFLQACLANDFVDAVCRADFESKWLLDQIGFYIHNHMPRPCSGSRAAVDAWVEGRTHDAIAIKPELELLDVEQVKGAQPS
jgi:hypothetical protein